MVISRITSGLGNQLFQYACGRAISLRRGVPLKLDLSNFQQYPNRRYALEAFRMAGTEASAEEIQELLRQDTLWQRLTTPRAHRRVIREKSFRFEADVRQAGPNVYLSGYWQSPYYFEDQAEPIRRELSWHQPPLPQTQPYLDQISQTHAVAVHVRRGDYVSNPGYAQRFGALPMTYYERALRYLAGRVEAPHAFVFSDEPDWVKAHFPNILPVTVVEGNPDTEDLRLMAACRYHIMANSTFSWWGAWLAPFPDKVILTPARFFLDPKLDTRDLVPPEWVRVEA